AKFSFLVHSHMLRHACGFKLANDGHDTRAIQAYLGHRSIMSTVRYAALTPNRFKNFWKDQVPPSTFRSVRQVALPSARRSVGAGRRDLLSSARPRVKTSQQDGENAG